MKARRGRSGSGGSTTRVLGSGMRKRSTSTCRMPPLMAEPSKRNPLRKTRGKSAVGILTVRPPPAISLNCRWTRLTPFSPRISIVRSISSDDGVANNGSSTVILDLDCWSTDVSGRFASLDVCHIAPFCTESPNVWMRIGVLCHFHKWQCSFYNKDPAQRRLLLALAPEHGGSSGPLSTLHIYVFVLRA